MKQQEEDYRKGESLLGRSGIIQKIGVYCYEVTIEKHNGAVGTIASEDEYLIVIGNDEESLAEKTEDEDEEDEGFMVSTSYNLVRSMELYPSEVEERFKLSESAIEDILNGENLELHDWSLKRNDYFDECKLTIEDLREQRKIDAEPFDEDEIISKIASEYVLTPKRKGALIKSIHQFKG